MRRFMISPQRLRELLLVGLLVLAICALVLTRYFEIQAQKADQMIASGQAQKERLTALQHRAREIQETLSRWKRLRESVHASLPRKARRGVEARRDGEELDEVLAALHGELKQMIAALPFGRPVSGRVTSGVGLRPSPWTGEMQYHAGLDIPNPIGTPVRASGDGTVESTDDRRGTVILNHGQDIKTHYAHLSKILVNRGDRVRKGTPIGQVGTRGRSTGPHLHYEVRVAGIAVDPRSFLISASHSD
jgi:murein DD-endopeptidase MepM/ murein hydrolase activator NlpD